MKDIKSKLIGWDKIPPDSLVLVQKVEDGYQIKAAWKRLATNSYTAFSHLNNNPDCFVLFKGVVVKKKRFT